MRSVKKKKYSTLILQSGTWTGKRTKLIGLAVVVTLSVFFFKVFQTRQFTILEMYLFSTIMAIIVYLWLFWALDFAVNKRTLFVILPQSTIFVFASVLFVQFFFLMKFQRMYEILLILLVLSVLFVGVYISFLTANIFAVSSYGKIPLEKVARTTSYILTALVVYFFTFVILASAQHIILILVLLLLVYIVVIGIHLSHLDLGKRLLRTGTLLSAWSLFVMVLALLPLTNRQEEVAAVPVITALSTMNIVTSIHERKSFWLSSLSYFLITVAIIWFLL